MILETRYYCATGALIGRGVVPIAPNQSVRVIPTDQDVIAIPSGQTVVAIQAKELVVPQIAEKSVVSGIPAPQKIAFTGQI